MWHIHVQGGGTHDYGLIVSVGSCRRSLQREPISFGDLASKYQQRYGHVWPKQRVGKIMRFLMRFPETFAIFSIQHKVLLQMYVGNHVHHPLLRTLRSGDPLTHSDI